MKTTYLRFIMVAALVTGFAARSSFAQSVSPAASSGFDYKAPPVADLTDMGKKLIELAQAMPPEKFTWRPGEHAPTVSELFLLAATQYFHVPSEWGLLKASGYEVEANAVTAGRGQVNIVPLEKTTRGDGSPADKDRVMRELFDSVAYFNGIVKTLTDAHLQKAIRIRGQDTTAYASLITMDGDVHEYFAQAVSYARLNGVILPWMEPRLRAQTERGWRTEVTQVKEKNNGRVGTVQAPPSQ